MDAVSSQSYSCPAFLLGINVLGNSRKPFGQLCVSLRLRHGDVCHTRAGCFLVILAAKRLLSCECGSIEIGEQNTSLRSRVSQGIREPKQTRTATAMPGARKDYCISLFLASLQLCIFVSWLKFLPFLPKFLLLHRLKLPKSNW